MNCDGMARLACAGCLAAAGIVASAEPENIARGKGYTFNAEPNYALCKDKDDGVQLTDGVWQKDPKASFWTRKETVGWNVNGPCERMVTVDLGRDEPICGFAWNFAAGRAGVSWPDLVFVYVSTDGKSWRFAGDLLAASEKENGALKRDGYAVCRLSSVRMPAHGRYVTFLVKTFNYLFVDEIEVYRGDRSLLSHDGNVPPVASPIAHYSAYRAHQNFFRDADKIGNAAMVLPPEARAALSVRLYGLNAAVMRARGWTRPFLWGCDRWANQDVIDLPKDADALAAVPSVALMRGETRSIAVNVSNPTEAELDVEASAEGFPAGANVELREVVHTLVKSGARVGGLLKGEGAAKIRVKVPSGTTKQLWVSFAKPTCAAGDYTGRIVCAGSAKDVCLHVAAVDFPARPRLHVGGWDYTDSGAKRPFGSPGNLKARMQRMREMFTDTPWGSAAVMPCGEKFDKEGRLVNADKLSFKAWNDWVDLWGEDARQYCVFMSRRETFHGERMGTPRFDRMVGEYMRAWYDGIRARLNGRRVLLLILDEPGKPEEDAIIVAWAKAIKAAAPEFVVFDDLAYDDPTKASAELLAVSDVLCPASPTVTARGTEDFYIARRREGKELWLYSCCGPSRTFDPVLYYRSQAWLAWRLGAKATHFWAFGCGGGIGNSLDPFAQTRTEYSPFFVTPTDACRAKQSEAIMESVEDYEYLALLADRIAAAKAAGKDVAAFEKLLAEAPGRVLSDEAWLKANRYTYAQGLYRYDWNQAVDHETVESVRCEILDALEKAR